MIAAPEELAGLALISIASFYVVREFVTAIRLLLTLAPEPRRSKPGGRP